MGWVDGLESFKPTPLGVHLELGWGESFKPAPRNCTLEVPGGRRPRSAAPSRRRRRARDPASRGVSGHHRFEGCRGVALGPTARFSARTTTTAGLANLFKELRNLLDILGIVLNDELRVLRVLRLAVVSSHFGPRVF